MSLLAAYSSLGLVSERLDYLFRDWHKCEVFCKLFVGYAPEGGETGYHYPVSVTFWLRS